MEIVGPVLVMLMVGSLVFFLIEIFYRGPHGLRLGWVLGLFTAASVLVSRISISEGLERAALFGFALSAATIYVTISLVDFEYGALFVLEPVVVIALVAIVMWSSNRLTWDCTVIDGSRDVSSIGLVELVKRNFSIRKRSQQNLEPESSARDNNENITASQSGRPAKTSLLFFFFASSKSQNTPGLWVFYFAFAAFPIFGFGQWFATPDPSWGYRWIFMLFAIYLASGLGLLMLTSLLGLERYLKKRGAVMPGSVSRAWVTIGTLVAMGVMLIILVLPSPSLSNGLDGALAFLTTNSKTTNPNAVGKDGQEEGDNPQGEKQQQENQDAKQKEGDQGKGGDSKSDEKGKNPSSDDNAKSQDSNTKPNKQESQGQKSKQDSNSKSPKSETNNDGSEKQSNQTQDPDQNSDSQPPKQDDSGDHNSNREQPDKQNQRPGNRPEPGNKEPDPQDAPPADDQQEDQERAEENQADQKQAKQGGNAKPQQQNAHPPASSSSNAASSVAKFFATVMKYIVFGVGGIALLILLWMFRDELAKIWAELFGKPKQEGTGQDQPASITQAAQPKVPFSRFKNPFLDGNSKRWSVAETIHYTFTALQAWGAGHEAPRDQDQTPHEYANCLQRIDKGVASEARKLADLLGESLYSGAELSRESLAELPRVWQLMELNSPDRRPLATHTQPRLVSDA
ncbi:MAG: hypothetical protein ACI814_004677 [Mariniblastus sp.]|jgi:hypothetical protein